MKIEACLLLLQLFLMNRNCLCLVCHCDSSPGFHAECIAEPSCSILPDDVGICYTVRGIYEGAESAYSGCLQKSSNPFWEENCNGTYNTATHLFRCCSTDNCNSVWFTDDYGTIDEKTTAPPTVPPTTMSTTSQAASTGDITEETTSMSPPGGLTTTSSQDLPSQSTNTGDYATSQPPAASTSSPPPETAETAFPPPETTLPPPEIAFPPPETASPPPGPALSRPVATSNSQSNNREPEPQYAWIIAVVASISIIFIVGTAMVVAVIVVTQTKWIKTSRSPSPVSDFRPSEPKTKLRAESYVVNAMEVATPASLDNIINWDESSSV